MENDLQRHLLSIQPLAKEIDQTQSGGRDFFAMTQKRGEEKAHRQHGAFFQTAGGAVGNIIQAPGLFQHAGPRIGVDPIAVVQCPGNCTDTNPKLMRQLRIPASGCVRSALFWGLEGVGVGGCKFMTEQLRRNSF
jgi:hypothetical protein